MFTSCELHILKEEWMDLPSIAIKCKLWNIKVASTADYNELVSQFQQKIYNRSVLAKIKVRHYNINIYIIICCFTVIY